jgi:uncharacterized protein YjbI with pentapeptide repeats
VPSPLENIPPEIPLDCKEQSTENSEFCIFHDINHYTEHEQEAAKRFKEKVKKSINQREPLICFGYYLPDINFANLLEGKSFAQPVYFNEATFSKEAIFGGAKFSKGAYFGGATFSKEAIFGKATFTEGAYFGGAKFTEEAYFGGATFSKEAISGDATFTEGAYFGSATFSKAYFGDATFTEGANFGDATFSKEANFGSATFSKGAYFGGATFTEVARFDSTKFLDEVYFYDNKFTGKTFFRDVTFEQQDKVKFDDNDLSRVSFAESDITRIRFGDKITWGKGKDKFTIVEEKWLREKAGGQRKIEAENVTLELVLSVYRNLRENYEFRLRYDDAGKFFIKEMELKRKYRDVLIDDLKVKVNPLYPKLRLKWDTREFDYRLEENCWFRKHFSLTGLYYHLSRYGESISRPTIFAAVTVFASTLFWLTQSNPILEPNFSVFLGGNDTSAVAAGNSNTTNSTFVGFEKAGNATQWQKAFERSFADFIPFLPAGDFKVGIIDFIIKIVGGALTFGLILIAFRRKFERKYTR